jgi:hypothetical protein
MVEIVTEACRQLIIYDKAYFSIVHLLVYCINLNIPLMQE